MALPTDPASLVSLAPSTDPYPTQTVELGPRSLALMRRMCFLLEQCAGIPGEDSGLKDPGPAFESQISDEGPTAAPPP